MISPHDFWTKVLSALQAGERCALLTVVQSIGSSPGRAGFRMCATSGGRLFGSIGGGSMEHKLVELARSLVDEPGRFPFIRRQVHRDGEARDRSGMICSGEQTVAFHLLDQQHLEPVQHALRDLRAAKSPFMALDHAGIRFHSTRPDDRLGLHQLPDGRWSFTTALNASPRIAIVGGGHVSLALSRTMAQLGFQVQVYNDREGLNTFEQNSAAHERFVVDYERITDHIPNDPELFIALVSFGYRTDELVLRQLLRRQCRYLGMLGSKAKVDTMFAKLRVEGFTEAELARVHAPIGIAINSRTPEEIAVSIAAQIIAVRNTDP